VESNKSAPRPPILPVFKGDCGESIHYFGFLACHQEGWIGGIEWMEEIQGHAPRRKAHPGAVHQIQDSVKAHAVDPFYDAPCFVHAIAR
jgi:hypothetical protein